MVTGTSYPEAKDKIANIDFSSDLTSLGNSLRKIPSSIVIGATNISFPPVSVLVGNFEDIVPFLGSIAKALLAVIIIRIFAAVIALVGSTVGALNDAIRFPVIVNTLAFATLANISLLVGATVITSEIVGESASVNNIGKAVGLDLSFGINFAIIEWVAAASSLVGTVYWLSVWFVEYRETSFSRTSRHPARIGDWYGLWEELKSDWRGPLGGSEESDEKALMGPALKGRTSGGNLEGIWI